MSEIEIVDVAHAVVYVLFFITGIVYGMAIGTKTTNKIEDTELSDRVKALRLLDNIFSSPDSSISYEKNSEILSAIKSLGGGYYHGSLVIDKELDELNNTYFICGAALLKFCREFARKLRKPLLNS